MRINSEQFYMINFLALLFLIIYAFIIFTFPQKMYCTKIIYFLKIIFEDLSFKSCIIISVCSLFIVISFYTVWFFYITKTEALFFLHTGAHLSIIKKFVIILNNCGIIFGGYWALCYKIVDLLLITSVVLLALAFQIKLFNINARLKKNAIQITKVTKKHWWRYTFFSTLNMIWIIFWARKIWFYVRILVEKAKDHINLGILEFDVSREDAAKFLIYIQHHKYFILALLITTVIMYTITNSKLLNVFPEWVTDIIRKINTTLIWTWLSLAAYFFWKATHLYTWEAAATILFKKKSALILLGIICRLTFEAFLIGIGIATICVLIGLFWISLLESKTIVRIKVFIAKKLFNFRRGFSFLMLALAIKLLMGAIIIFLRFIITGAIITPLMLWQAYILAAVLTLVTIAIMIILICMINTFIFKKFKFFKNKKKIKIFLIILLIIYCLILDPLYIITVI